MGSSFVFRGTGGTRYPYLDTSEKVPCLREPKHRFFGRGSEIFSSKLTSSKGTCCSLTCQQGKGKGRGDFRGIGDETNTKQLTRSKRDKREMEET